MEGNARGTTPHPVEYEDIVDLAATLARRDNCPRIVETVILRPTYATPLVDVDVRWRDLAEQYRRLAAAILKGEATQDEGDIRPHEAPPPPPQAATPVIRPELVPPPPPPVRAAPAPEPDPEFDPALYTEWSGSIRWQRTFRPPIPECYDPAHAPPGTQAGAWAGLAEAAQPPPEDRTLKWPLAAEGRPDSVSVLSRATEGCKALTTTRFFDNRIVFRGDTGPCATSSPAATRAAGAGLDEPIEVSTEFFISTLSEFCLVQRRPVSTIAVGEGIRGIPWHNTTRTYR